MMNRKKKRSFNHWTLRLSRAYYNIRWDSIPKYQRQGHRLKKVGNVNRGFIPRLYHLLKGK